MLHPFDETFQRQVASRCAAFPRLAASDAFRDLRRAAVAIALVEAQQLPGATAFLLTRRVANLRAHGNQWALPGGRCDEGEAAVAAALRELEEEIGLCVGVDRVLGTL